jgi:hypothetical protein
MQFSAVSGTLPVNGQLYTSLEKGVSSEKGETSGAPGGPLRIGA